MSRAGVLREIVSVSRDESQYDIATLQARAEERALAEIRERRYVSGARVVRSEFGFYAADEGVAQRTAEPTFRVLVEMQTNEGLQAHRKALPGWRAHRREVTERVECDIWVHHRFTILCRDAEVRQVTCMRIPTLLL